MWNIVNEWCECPNIATLPDASKQVKTTWDLGALVCKCPTPPSGAIGLTLAAGFPTYCQCPNPTLNAATEMALVLSGTFDSCVCPNPPIVNPSREVNLVVNNGNDRCICPSKSSALDSTTESALELSGQLCQCPYNLIPPDLSSTFLVLHSSFSYCTCPQS